MVMPFFQSPQTPGRAAKLSRTVPLLDRADPLCQGLGEQAPGQNQTSSSGRHGRMARRAYGCSMISWSACTALLSSDWPSQKSARLRSSGLGSRRAISISLSRAAGSFR